MKLRRQTIRIVTPGLQWDKLKREVAQNGGGSCTEIQSHLVPLSSSGATDGARMEETSQFDFSSFIGEAARIRPILEGHWMRTAEPDFNPDVNWWRNFEMGRLT